ncbi:hypothetical protein CORC01_01379 [Colletotrichum orchidophilum]|uniref:Uncharacterized protein n=1 Tax=Colletotrichum orchidophilum TaxID=1209926 RepID=A0A1G4BPW7_9PEZI|nr:uncharacterized protein CORC01_01379 [Colletotrichum orchidophilum]OHF03326.1 hypothetical protein CORC01_01379 [Colletotrichum orchidophilum]
MTRSDDVTPTPALTGRLLRALGLPSSSLSRRQRLQRGLCHGVSTTVWAATETTWTTDTTDANALELIAWPYSTPAPATDPSTPTWTTTTDCCSPSRDCAHDPLETTTRRRHSQQPLDRPQGHRRANSLDSTTTDLSTDSSSSTSSSVSSRSRWNLFSSATNELTASNRRSNGVDDTRTAGCAAIIFTGATYGAGLKTQKEWKEERQSFWGSPYDEQISLLQGQRGRLVSERRNWERKLEYLDERIKEREEKKPES